MPDPTAPPMGDDQAVLALVEEEIAGLALGPGDRLPTERELASRIGRNRSAIRRALGAMEAEGRLLRQVGRGTFLLDRPSAPSSPDGTAPTSPAEIMAVRLLIEPQLMPLVVLAATPGDIEEMHRCLRGGEGADTYEDFERWDAALHRSFAIATHNGLVAQINDLLGATRHEPLWGGLKRRSSTPDRRAAYRDDHQAIVTALVERDAPLAQRAMRDHLLRVRANLLGDSH